jgi:hypothetical protein
MIVLFASAGLSGCREGQSDRGAENAARTVDDAEAAKAKAREDAAAARDAGRLAALWSYADVPVEKGRQLSAAIYSTNDVDSDGKGPRRVRLVFRDHASWGRSSYLVLQGGDFNCYGGCTVTVTADGDTPKPMAARRPRTDEAIAMFINDARALWRLTAEAKQLSVEFPVTAGGSRTATFDVAGLDPSKMPGWDTAGGLRPSSVDIPHQPVYAHVGLPQESQPDPARSLIVAIPAKGEPS